MQFLPVFLHGFRRETFQHTFAFRGKQRHDPGRIEPDVAAEIGIGTVRFAGAGTHDHFIFPDFSGGELGRGRKQPDGFHGITEKFDSGRGIGRGGKDIGQAAAAGKFAFLHDFRLVIIIHPGQQFGQFLRRQGHAGPDRQLAMTHAFRIGNRREFRRRRSDQNIRRTVQHPVKDLGAGNFLFHQFPSVAGPVRQQQNFRRETGAVRPLEQFVPDLFSQCKPRDFDQQPDFWSTAMHGQDQQRCHTFIDRTEAIPGKNNIFQPFS